MDYSILTGFAVRYMMTKKRTLNTILKDKDLNTVDGVLLVFIGRHSDVSQEEIGEKTLFDGASIARSLKRLEAAEMATRRIHPTNHRKKLVTLTPEGEKFLQEVSAADKEISDQLFTNIADDDQKALERILTQAYANFDELDFPK